VSNALIEALSRPCKIGIDLTNYEPGMSANVPARRWYENLTSLVVDLNHRNPIDPVTEDALQTNCIMARISGPTEAEAFEQGAMLASDSLEPWGKPLWRTVFTPLQGL
jgi:hypothetical protein